MTRSKCHAFVKLFYDFLVCTPRLPWKFNYTAALGGHQWVSLDCPDTTCHTGLEPMHFHPRCLTIAMSKSISSNLNYTLSIEAHRSRSYNYCPTYSPVLPFVRQKNIRTRRWGCAHVPFCLHWIPPNMTGSAVPTRGPQSVKVDYCAFSFGSGHSFSPWSSRACPRWPQPSRASLSSPSPLCLAWVNRPCSRA